MSASAYEPYFGADAIRRANAALTRERFLLGKPYVFNMPNGTVMRIPRPSREEMALAGEKAMATHLARKAIAEEP